MRLHTGLAPLALALLALPSAAADVLVVDDSGGAGVDFITLQAAVAAAQDGDVVLVRSGTYSGDVLVDAKSLVITADAGAAVGYSGLLTIQNLAAGQSVGWSGFDLTYGFLDVVSCFGPVWIEDTTFQVPLFAGGQQTVRIQDCHSVMFIRCSIDAGMFVIGSNPAIRMSNAAVYLYDSSIAGGDGYSGLSLPVEGGPGVLVESGVLFSLSSAIQGGQGSPIGSPFGCTGTSPDGGPAVFLTGVADFYDTTLQGGPPGELLGAGSCTQGDPGQWVEGAGTWSLHPWPERHLTVTTPVRTDELVGVDISVQQGDLTWLIFSSSRVIYTVWWVVGPLAVGGSPVIVPLGALPAGQTSFSVQTFVPPGEEAHVYHVQPLFVDTLGFATLGEPAHVVELDASL